MLTPDPTSALYWLPKIVDVCPTPETRVVEYDHQQAVAALGGDKSYDDWPNIVNSVWNAAMDIGLPTFVRTDLASAKHNGPSAYRIERQSDVGNALSETVEDNEMKLWLTGPMPRAFLVRRWLRLDAPFTAFGGHPIAREWRYFVSDGAVTCSHFYWPEDAIHSPSRPEWRSVLANMAEREPPPKLSAMARRAAKVCPDLTEWSVDFACDQAGRWWLIDMANGEQSWHPTHEEAHAHS